MDEPPKPRFGFLKMGRSYVVFPADGSLTFGFGDLRPNSHEDELQHGHRPFNRLELKEG